MIPLGTFEPDKSPFNTSASIEISNVLPVSDGWAPMKSFSALSGALTEQCYGAIDAQQTDGTYTLFALTTTTMNRYVTATQTWADVTPTAGATNLPNGDLWSMTDYGSYVVATNYNDGPQVYEVGVSTEFAALAGSPPNARYVNAAGEYLFLMHTSTNPQLVQWSGIGDITEWTNGQGSSSSQTIPDAGPIMGSARAPNGLYVICQDQINMFTFNPTGPYTFTRTVANPSRGCVSPGSIVEAAGTFFYLDEDGFYMGVEGSPIGAEKVNRYFLDNIDEDFLSEVQGAVDASNKMIWWRYRKTDATYELLGYDWQLQRWTRVTTSINYLFNVHSPGYTLDGLDNISATLDGLPYSLDSRVWKGGRPALAGFDSDNKFGYFAGTNMEAVMQTADVALAGDYSRAYVGGYRAKTDAPTVTGRVAGMDFPGDSKTWSTSASPEPSTGLIPAHSDYDLHRFELTIPAGTVWTHAHAILPQYKPAGRR